MASHLRDLDGFRLAVDCRSAGCRGERASLVAELAASFGPDTTVAAVLRRMRCAHGCGGRVLAARLETGPMQKRAYPGHSVCSCYATRPMLGIHLSIPLGFRCSLGRYSVFGLML